jgi:hypothetical protein
MSPASLMLGAASPESAFFEKKEVDDALIALW